MTTGSNPSGVGGATWNGIAEATSTRTFIRRAGTALASIPDLSNPLISIDIDLPDIVSLSWDDMRLDNGRYEAGTAGSNHLVGDFYGPDHRETYGIFDTGAYVGAFGAKRRE